MNFITTNKVNSKSELKNRLYSTYSENRKITEKRKKKKQYIVGENKELLITYTYMEIKVSNDLKTYKVFSHFAIINLKVHSENEKISIAFY